MMHTEEQQQKAIRAGRLKQLIAQFATEYRPSAAELVATLAGEASAIARQADTPDISGELLAQLELLEMMYSNLHMDETVQWAINELSDQAHAHLFDPIQGTVEAFRRWKAARAQ